jgi:hypothetical protein
MNGVGLLLEAVRRAVREIRINGPILSRNVAIQALRSCSNTARAQTHPVAVPAQFSNISGASMEDWDKASQQTPSYAHRASSSQLAIKEPKRFEQSRRARLEAPIFRDLRLQPWATFIETLAQ